MIGFTAPVQLLYWPHFGRAHIGVMVRTGWEPEGCLTFIIVRGSPHPERFDVESPCGGMCPLLEPHCHVETEYWTYDPALDAWIAPEPPDTTIRTGKGWFARQLN